MQFNNKGNITNLIESIIFNSKWLLIPFYLKLFWTLIKLLQHFVFEGHLSNEHLMETLEDVDIVMIANLVKMIITGSYNSFVDKNHKFTGEQVSSGALKVKMSTSIIGVSSIHLLQTFINAANILDMNLIYKQVLIHVVFIVGAIALAHIDLLHAKSEAIEHSHKHPPKLPTDSIKEPHSIH